MFKFLLLIACSILIASCGSLNYVSPPTAENAGTQRKENIEWYIQNQYKDSAVTYNSLLFGETTVVKPTNFILLDSLFKIKYNNELKGNYDSELESKIGNQQQIIQRDTSKVKYIEHHVYSISDKTRSEISFADITLDPKGNVSDFKITEQVTIPEKYKQLFSAYLSEESILQPPYNASTEERNFYEFYKRRREELPSGEKSEFLIHTLSLLEISRRIRSIETKKLLQELTVQSVFNRSYDANQDRFQAIDGEFIDNKLVGYAVVILVNNVPSTVRFNSYLEKVN